MLDGAVRARSPTALPIAQTAPLLPCRRIDSRQHHAPGATVCAHRSMHIASHRPTGRHVVGTLGRVESSHQRLLASRSAGEPGCHPQPREPRQREGTDLHVEEEDRERASRLAHTQRRSALRSDAR